MSKKILLIEDDVSFCMMIQTFLQKKGFEVQSVYSFKEAEGIIKDDKELDLVLTDVRLPDSDGVEILKYIKKINSRIQVILMTGYTDIKTAVNVMKLGAFDYVEKPINSDEIITKINQALSNKPTSQVNESTIEIENTSNQTNQVSQKSYDFVKGNNPKSKELYNYINVVAPTNISVLIIGDSGTGKENIAFEIHKQSKRKNCPYIAVDCGAIPKDLAASEFFGHVKGSFTGATSDKIGHFEAANGGTIFLDEVGNLSYDVQVQLLRALQERKVKPVGSSKEVEVDIRIIAATNEDLQKAVREGDFREDLYHRLNEFTITSPRLKDRGNDILEFADFFLHSSNIDLEKNVLGFSDQVKEIFLKYEWPGNLREMKNVVKRSVLLSQNDLIQVDVLPNEIKENKSFLREHTDGEGFISYQKESIEPRDISDFKLFSSKNEEQLIKAALEKSKYNKTKAATILGIDRKTLYNKMKLYGIEL